LTPLANGVEVPRSPEQVARTYGVNPSFLTQWVEEMRRSNGAPHSVMYAMFAYSAKSTLDG
jgi:transposase-like protein